MQPLELPDIVISGLAWQINCDNDLYIIIAVIERRVLLLSATAGELDDAAWNQGSYASDAEAQRTAVNMTSSYERLRAGVVLNPIEVKVPAQYWNQPMGENKNAVDPMVGRIVFTQVFDSALAS